MYLMPEKISDFDTGQESPPQIRKSRRSFSPIAWIVLVTISTIAPSGFKNGSIGFIVVSVIFSVVPGTGVPDPGVPDPGVPGTGVSGPGVSGPGGPGEPGGPVGPGGPGGPVGTIRLDAGHA